MTTVISEDHQALRDALKVQPPDVIKYLNLLTYGDPGVGKTFLTGTAADSDNTSPVLILDVEGGLTTIRHRTDVDTKAIRSMKDIEDIYNTLYKSIRTVDDEPTIYYKTVCIDSLTELAALDMKVIMQKAFDKNPDKIEKEVPDQRAWGICREHIRNIVRAFRDLPCNVIYTASVATLQEEGQPTKYFPGFAGKLRTDVPGFMDIVGYQFSETVGAGENTRIVRKMQFQGTRRVVAKDRTGSLGQLLEDPTIPLMWEMINKTQPETEDIEIQVVEPTTITKPEIETEIEKPTLSIITDKTKIEGENNNDE